MVYQPIVSWSGRCAIGYEALVRSREPHCPHQAPSSTRRSDSSELQLRRAIRTLAPMPFGGRDDDGSWLFLNMHIDDLTDDEPLEEGLVSMGHRIVLEVTERANINRSLAPRIGSRVFESKASALRGRSRRRLPGLTGRDPRAGIAGSTPDLVRGIDAPSSSDSSRVCSRRAPTQA
jgi:hypothetical protein